MKSKGKEKLTIWDNVEDFLKTYHKMQDKKWSWIKNSSCKYVNLRIDMRDGGCIIMDRDSNRISPENLAYQYGEEKS